MSTLIDQTAFSHVIPLSSTVYSVHKKNLVSGRFFSVVFSQLENSIIVSLKVLKEVTDRLKIRLMVFI